ncbi:hypothetical protein [Bacillus sp. AFS041924]|uniref:hypothetical protein n=1 Tax=Bacillus sp. AFS041924 TaxID=2033503 RepID=UPI00159BA3D2|nr:hypothetical protein [Bacillus sp. AFS041924]
METNVIDGNTDTAFGGYTLVNAEMWDCGRVVNPAGIFIIAYFKEFTSVSSNFFVYINIFLSSPDRKFASIKIILIIIIILKEQIEVNKYLKIGLLIAGLIAVSFLSWKIVEIIVFKNEYHVTNIKYDREKIPPASKEGKDIAATHDILNNLTGWLNYQQFKNPNSSAWEDEKDELTAVSTYFEKLFSKVDKNGDLYDDLDLANKLMNLAIDKKDVKALLYTHRIMHDLDNKLNYSQGKIVVFNSAKAGNGNAERIDNYIEYLRKHQ